MEPPVLALPRADRPFMIDTDASSYQLGAVLLQQQDDNESKNWSTIGYWSRSLTKAEKNYSATERECLSVVWAMQTLRPYVDGQHFHVRTDHAALKWLLTIKDPTGRLARWGHRLSVFDYEIIHRPGRKHQVPDALSRLVSPHEHVNGDLVPIDDEIPTFDDTINVVTRRQRSKLRTEGIIKDPSVHFDEPLLSPNGEHECGTPRACIMDMSIASTSISASSMSELSRTLGSSGALGVPHSCSPFGLISGSS